MGMMNPAVNEPLDKLSDKFKEGEAFFLEGIRTVEANTQAYGKGEMVVLKVRGAERELGVWGSYLLHQAKSVAASDLGRWYKVERTQIEGFGKGGREVKAFVPAEPPTPAPVQTQMGSDS